MTAAASEAVLSRWAALQDLSAALAKGVPCLRADGLWGSSRALVAAALLHATGRAVLLLTAGAPERHRAATDLRFFLASLSGSTESVLEFPSGSAVSWRGGRHREPDAERALCCHRLLRGDPVAVVATPSALSVPLLSPIEFRSRSFTLAVGEALTRERLLGRLDAAGYERVETVVEVGQWSLRGGIVDVFSPTHDRPARAEFFGDEVESLRLFDPTTQRSVEPLSELVVLPLAPKTAESASLTAYLPADALVALEDPALLEAPPDDAPASEPLHALLGAYQRLEMPLLQRGAAGPARVAMETRSVGGFRGQFKTLAAEIRAWRAEGFTVRLVVDDDLQACRWRTPFAGECRRPGRSS
jgi:transcription-repair coupling factor (superfamily II helicase)